MLKKLVLATAAVGLLMSTAGADYYIVQEKATKKCKVVETRPTTWRTVRMTDKTGSETDVRMSDNFEQLSPREQMQRVDEFIGLV